MSYKHARCATGYCALYNITILLSIHYEDYPTIAFEYGVE